MVVSRDLDGSPLEVLRMPRIMPTMALNGFVAEKRGHLFGELLAGKTPSEGDFDPAVHAEGKAKGSPQLGATRFEPDAVVFEFIYPAEAGTSTILSVKIAAPERIVFLPVPPWVVESIWQGEVDGSYYFESEARQVLADFAQQLEEVANRRWFGPRSPKRRE